MKLKKIQINKSPEKPEGVPLDVVEPQGDMEKRLLGFLLRSYLSDAKHRKALKLDLPENFDIDYNKDGHFVVMSQPSATGAGFYEPGKPTAVLVIHPVGGSFGVAHAEIRSRGKAAAKAPGK